MRETVSRENWLKSLKVGDEVAVPIGFSGKRWNIYRLTHATANFVLISNTKFRRSDGWAVGRDTWSSNQIQPVTDEIRHAKERDALIMALTRVIWESLPTETLRQIATLSKPKVNGNDSPIPQQENNNA